MHYPLAFVNASPSCNISADHDGWQARLGEEDGLQLGQAVLDVSVNSFIFLQRGHFV